MTACGRRGLKEDLNSFCETEILSLPCDIGTKKKKKTSEVVEECLNVEGLKDLVTCSEQR